MSAYSVANAVISSCGKLLSLKSPSGMELVSPGELWSLCLATDECQEIEVCSSGDPEINELEDGLEMRYSEVCDSLGRIYDIDVKVIISAADGKLAMGIELANNVPGTVVRECRFPVLKLSPAAEKFAWRNSQKAGTVHPSIEAWKNSKLNAAPGYQGLDEVFRREILHYPGKMATTNSYILDGGDEGVYLGSHDTSFQTTLHIAQANVEDSSVNMMMVKLPFLEAGKSFVCRDFILSAYSGTWHKGADIYREFLVKNIALPQIPEKLKFFNGWERLILRTQYGENLFTYRDLPAAAAELKECGVDSLLIFGWHSGGHDNDYPNYCVSESLGGYDEFKKAIAQVKAMGIQVNLYSNGQLIDRTSEFYRSGAGPRSAIRDIRGVEESQRWGFSGYGIYNSYFGGRTFSRACPCAAEMTEKLYEFVDLAYDLGADGVFFDQLGSGDPICFAPDHGHEVPFTRIMTARRDMLLKLREYAHSKGLTIGIEHASDITAGCVDYVHSMPGGAAVRGKITDGVKPFIPTDFEYFHYVFPEAQISNREIRDDNDIERRVNRMLLFGLQTDVEIKRCRAAIGTTPHYKAYLTEALSFKKRNRRYLEDAKFRSTADVRAEGKDIDVAGFLLPDGTYTVLATQSHLEEAELVPSGFALSECDHIDVLGEAEQLPGGKMLLKRHALVLMHINRLCS